MSNTLPLKKYVMLPIKKKKKGFHREKHIKVKLYLWYDYNYIIKEEKCTEKTDTLLVRVVFH